MFMRYEISLHICGLDYVNNDKS